MDSQVFWISPTQLEFCERIDTWDGQCIADKNGVFRTSYLVDKGIIAAGHQYAAEGHHRGRPPVCCTSAESGVGDALLREDTELIALLRP